MELTKEEKRIAVAAYRKDSVSADPHAEVYAACEAVLESRAASDQGLRKAAQEAITKIESIAPMIDSVVFLPSPANTPWDILGLLPCAQALKAALARQVKDGPVLGEEQPPYKKCGKVAQTFIASEGSFFPCALEEGHQGPCLQSGTCFRHGVYFGENCPHWPKCADQLLAPRREPSHPMSGTMQDEVRVTDRAQEPLSQQEAEPKFGHHPDPLIDAQVEVDRLRGHLKTAETVLSDVLSLDVASANGQRVKNNVRWAIGEIYGDENMKAVAPASVQPSTEDVVAQMVAVAETAGQHHSNPLMILRCQMHAALPVARAGLHSWESVEKAIRAETDECSDVDKFIIDIRACLEAEPAERVTDPAVEAVAMVICTKCGARVGYPELHNKWHNIYAELDAQGDNKACITVSNEEYLALERVAREMQEALVARQEADATWKNDRTAHNVCHEMTKKADDLARTALAAFDKAKEGK